MTTSPIPNPRDDDPEDVSWALSTAATSYARGDRVEALKWLRRAAESASEEEKDERALELAKAAADLANMPSIAPEPTPPLMQQMPTVVIPTTPASRPSSAMPPPPPSSRPAPSRPPPSRPAPPPSKPSVAAKTGADASAPFPLVIPPAPETKPGFAPMQTKRAATRNTNETVKRPAMKSKSDARPRASSANDERTETLIITEVTKREAKPAGAIEADAWPTESMGSEDLDSLNEVYGQERTRIGQPAYKPEEPERAQKPAKVAFRASQAVHVMLWRDPDGTLRIAPKGTSVSAVTIDALLVAPGPDVDLLAWLSPD